jgi:hypothetical protein
MDLTEKDFIAYKEYVDLWASENPIKTNKMIALPVINALLVSAMQMVQGLLAQWTVLMAGAVFSAVGTMSIGGTCQFQKVWQTKAMELSKNHPEDPRFDLLETEAAELAAPGWLRICGTVPSKCYLLGTPVFCALAWTVGLVWTVW